MAKLKLTLACTVTDRSSAVLNGYVPVEGCEIVPMPGRAQEIFRRTLQEEAFDIAELSMSSYMVAASRGIVDYVAIPVFLSRSFRHSSMYVRKDLGIRSGAELAGKRVGLEQFQQTAALWVRGFLREEHTLDTHAVKWRTGGLDVPLSTGERVGVNLPPEVDIQPIAAGETLDGLLLSGDLDAVLMPRVPSSFVSHPDVVVRLFPNFKELEVEYFRRTRMFPIMHTVVIRKSLCDAYPWLPVAVYKAFARAKADALHALTQVNISAVSLAWVADNAARTREILGDQMWAYGLPASRHEVEAMIRYAMADGMLATALTPEDLFHASTHQLPDTL